MGTDYAEHTQQPEYHEDNHHSIQDLFDFPIHGDVGVNEPQHHTHNDKNDNQGDKGHFRPPIF
jgi:hypothetical protein